jgi:hypothetical protein
MATDQVIAQDDLILISDSGQFYVIKMTASGAFHEPDHIEPLDPTFQVLPDSLRAAGVELADLPDHAVDAGCSCYLLNLQSLSGHVPASLPAKVTFSLQASTAARPRAAKATAKGRAKPAPKGKAKPAPRAAKRGAGAKKR